jgi:hypothetical protein
MVDGATIVLMARMRFPPQRFPKLENLASRSRQMVAVSGRFEMSKTLSKDIEKMNPFKSKRWISGRQ